MWFIKNEQGDIIYLKPNKTMTVGRKKERDIFLDNDASISKIHATITVRPKVNFEPNETSSTVIVEDSGSKYGTFMIDARDKLRKLTPGCHEFTATDKVKFGLTHHTFTFHYVPLIISTSTLNAREKTELRNIIDILDGVFVDEWKEYCSHLTVSNVTLTTQVVQALTYGTPIVELKYWDAVLKSVQINEKLPEINNFIPAVNEGLVNQESILLKANPERRSLFKDIVFVSFSDPQCALQNIIKYAGGKLKLFKEDTFNLKQLCSDNLVLIQIASNTSLPSQAALNLYDSIERNLQKKKLRLIPEFEIFLAILYCSMEKYCNPKFDFKRLLNFNRKNKNLLSDPILAEDTEVIMPTEKNRPAVIIKESLTASEQFEEQESRNFNKVKSSLGRKFTDNLKDLPQSAVGGKKIIEKHNFGSEESSRESALMIDETRSSVESDGNDANTKKRNFSKVLDEFEDQQTIPATHSTGRRFNLQSKLQSSKSSNKDLSKKNETCINFYSNPSTSKDTSNNVTGGEETSPLKPTKNITAQKSKEQTFKEEIETDDVKAGITNIGKAQNLRSVNNDSKISKRSKTEDDIFSFVNLRSSKKKSAMRDDEDDSFETPEDRNARKLHQEDNIVEKGINQTKKYQNKRRRSSLSSNEDFSSDDEQPPKIKIEKHDSENEIDHAPLIKCKKELDSSMDDTCKSSIVSLLRPDIDLTFNVTETNSKNFVKVYTEVPKHRIKLKNMYVWKPNDDDDMIICEPNDEELTSGDDDNDDFSHDRNTAVKKGREKKKITIY